MPPLAFFIAGTGKDQPVLVQATPSFKLIRDHIVVEAGDLGSRNCGMLVAVVTGRGNALSRPFRPADQTKQQHVRGDTRLKIKRGGLRHLDRRRGLDRPAKRCQCLGGRKVVGDYALAGQCCP